MIENCDVQEEEEEEARHKIYNGTLWEVQNKITNFKPSSWTEELLKECVKVKHSP